MPSCVRSGFRGFISLIVGMLLLLICDIPAQAGLLNVALTAPTTNVDGTPLTDLASYRIYYATTSTPCPGSTYQTVTSPNSSPAQGDVMRSTITGLTTNSTYYVQATAVDSSGSESACSNQANGVAKADTAETTPPTGSLSINSGATTALWLTVTLSLTATDNVGVTGYYISNSTTVPAATASGWVAVSSTTSYSNTGVAYTLPRGDGPKTVYAWYKDAAGNVSTTASATITLQTHPAAPAGLRLRTGG